jgi:hypothetical protein
MDSGFAAFAAPRNDESAFCGVDIKTPLLNDLEHRQRARACLKSQRCCGTTTQGV